MARGAAPLLPCSGRSEAISTSGVRPPESTSLQREAGSVPDCAPAALLTQADPAPAASAWAPPTGMCVTLFVAGSIRATVLLM
jgi:hypothetical protein